MPAAIVLLGVIALFLVGYRYYSPYLASKVYALDGSVTTPAHRFEDGVDFVPTNRHIVFSHHFVSVAGAAPIVGPAIAVFWGWGPALAWVVLGTIFAAGVHDFGALVVSVRHDAKSIGTLTKEVISGRGRVLFLAIIFFLLTMVNAVFAIVIAGLFIDYPQAVLPILVEIPLAIGVGQIVYKRRTAAIGPSIIALLLVYASIPLGLQLPIELDGIAGALGTDPTTLWIVLLFAYAFVASRLPVWLLLQPRDYINQHQMIAGFVILFAGILVGWNTIAAPLLNDVPAGSPPLLPLLFVTIACGAISGFHSLVSSGTTSKQIDKETDSRFVGYFGAVGEGTLALCSILACTAGVVVFAAASGDATGGAWQGRYGDWDSASGGATNNFVEGVAGFASNIGVPLTVGVVFGVVLVVSFAATTMDTGVRLQRYIVQEIGEIIRVRPLARNLTLATLVATLIPFALALNGELAFGRLWQLFGTTNQLTAGLALAVVAVWVTRNRRNATAVLVPFAFLMVVTTWALVYNMIEFFREGDWLLGPIDLAILVLAVWLVVEAGLALWRARTERDLPAGDAGVAASSRDER